MKEIEYIEIDGHFDFRRVTPWDYEQTRDEFNKEDIDLPLAKRLYKYGDPEKLWILLDDCLKIDIYYKDQTVPDTFIAKKGFIFDKATIPLFKDNKRTAMIGLVIHDMLFSTHALSFSETNELFYKILRCEKIKYNNTLGAYSTMSWLGANIYKVSTSSIFGKRRWKKTDRPCQISHSQIILSKQLTNRDKDITTVLED